MKRIVALLLLSFAGITASAHAQTSGNDPLNDPLRAAISQGDVPAVRNLLAHGASWGKPNEALHIAVTCHQSATVTFLLVHGAPLDARGAAGAQLLTDAALGDAPDLVTVLLDHHVSPNVLAPQADAPPLNLAVRHRNWNSTVVLVRRGAAFDWKDRWGRTPLMEAADNHDLGTMRLLLSRGADANAIDRERHTVLWHALTVGESHEAALLLIYHGAIPHRAGQRNDLITGAGLTHLLAAAQEGDFGRVRALIRAGAPLREDGPELLLHAAQRGDLPTIQLLLTHGVPAHSALPRGKLADTGALGGAARAGHTDVVRFLLAQPGHWEEADVTPGPQSDTDPILVAVAAAGHTAVARLLLAAGFAPDRPSLEFITDGNQHWGDTPLLAAVAGGHREIVALLLEKGVKVNAVLPQDVRGQQTALTVAARVGNKAMVRFLLSHGADPHIAANGKTPAQIAREAGHPTVAALLSRP